MTKEKFEPVQIYIDKDLIEKERLNIELYLDFINSFAEELEKSGVVLDDELLEEFSQNGHNAIYKRIMQEVKAKGDLKLLQNEINAGALREAARFSQTAFNLQNIQIKTGMDLSKIAVLNGKATLRGGVLEEITRRNTILLKTPEEQELHDRLTKFAESFNELKKYIKEVRPDCERLDNQIIAGFTDAFYFMGKIVAGDSCLIAAPDTDSDLIVNPLFFK